MKLKVLWCAVAVLLVAFPAGLAVALLKGQDGGDLCRQIIPLRARVVDLVQSERWGRKVIVRYEASVPFIVDLSSASFKHGTDSVEISNLKHPYAGDVCITNEEVVRDNVDKWSALGDLGRMLEDGAQEAEARCKEAIANREELVDTARGNAMRILQGFYKKQGKKVSVKW